jgi:hypothetical protein
VFDGGSLQMGNFPPFLPDGAGGAVFAWYEVEPAQTRVQWLRADGTPVFEPNGALAAATRADRKLVEPHAALNRTTGEIFVFWREVMEGTGGPFRMGLSGQRLSATGARQWGDEGRAVVAIDTTELVQLQSLPAGDGVLVAYVATLAFDDQRIWLRRLDAAGDDVWSPGPVAVSSAASGKSRLFMAPAADGAAVLGWSDTRAGDDDVYVQYVGADGTLGPPAGESPAIYLPLAQRGGAR